MRLAFSRFSCLLGLLAAAGCGSENQRPVHQLQGQAFVDGKPAAHALVVFHSLDPAATDFPRPHAQVQPDGSFNLGTYQPRDGAPEGDYAVTIEWWLSSGKTDDPPTNRLPARYARQQTSGLRARVQPGDNPPLLLHLKRQ